MAEYRAAIGGFAAVTLHLQSYQRRKKRSVKATHTNEPRVTKKKPREEDGFKHDKYDRGWGSLDRWKTKGGGNHNQRSITLCPRLKPEGIKRIIPSLRERSQSCARRREGASGLSNLKDACNVCKTEWVIQGGQRGRPRKESRRMDLSPCCKTSGENPKKIEEVPLRLFTCLAVSECLLTELALATVVHILLIRSGIETNPGDFLAVVVIR